MRKFGVTDRSIGIASSRLNWIVGLTLRVRIASRGSGRLRSRPIGGGIHETMAHGDRNHPGLAGHWHGRPSPNWRWSRPSWSNVTRHGASTWHVGPKRPGRNGYVGNGGRVDGGRIDWYAVLRLLRRVLSTLASHGRHRLQRNGWVPRLLLGPVRLLGISDVSFQRLDRHSRGDAILLQMDSEPKQDLLLSHAEHSDSGAK